MFTNSDIEQLKAHGISVEQAESQLNNFRTGFPELNIVRSAIVGNGILQPSKEEEEYYIAKWEEYLQGNHKILKFVPASGAASRMFKDLFTYLEDGQETTFIQKFLTNKDKFAFGKSLADKNGQAAVDYLLNNMNYGKLPKGLLLFHKYEEGNRTPALEHLVEGALYAKNADNEVNIHFTVSHEHLELFKAHIAENVDYFEKKYGVKYHISFSEQKPSTDTLAADKEGNPFRDKDGKLVFRPGGHGALIENLNEQDADIVFIKNIDNVVPDRLKDDTIRYKKLLAGILVSEMEKYPNQPVRVCGMVKNQGEPGGGPFIVKDKDGKLSCQILESSQIADKSLMATATHFNPVDLVCSIKSPRGEHFDLRQFVDPETGFISQKSKDGKELQALELPGLWNGAMAKWHTIFVEVPISTFNPVKNVNDLLREQHQ